MNYLLTASTIGSWLDTTFAGFDMAVFKFFGSIQSEFLNVVAKLLTALSEPVFFILLGMLGLVLITFRKTRKAGLALVIAICIGTLLTNGCIKPVVLRVRPYNTLQHITEYFGWYTNAGMLAESDFCFPSGHTTAAFEIAVSMFLVFWNDKKKKLAWILLVVAFFIGFSRIYLMVHYASDIVGGIIVGTLAGILGYVISSKITKRCEKSFRWYYLDMERVIREKTGREITHRAACIIITIAVACIFAISVLRSYKSVNNAQRCAYDEEYKCYNEAKENDKYLIDGQYYCKIHTKELKEQGK